MMRVYPEGIEHCLGEVDGIALRFHIAARLMKMLYGEKVAIPKDVVLKAWPPTGDYDRSEIAVFRALSLAARGHRPEPSMTTEERIMADLDESFSFFVDWGSNGDWIFSRSRHACPKCSGYGYYECYDLTKVPPLVPLSAEIPEMVMHVSKLTIECDHRPQ